jgi:hypothetical protein
MTDQATQESAAPDQSQSEATSDGLTPEQYLHKIVQTTADMLGILEIEQSGLERYAEVNGDLAALELQGKFFLFTATLMEMQSNAKKVLEEMRPKPTILTAGNIVGRDGRPIDLRKKGKRK